MDEFVGIFLFIFWCGVVAICDCRSRRIPNSIVIAGLVTAFACAFVECGPFGISFARAGLGVLVGLLALMPFFALGVMGAADVKVFAVLGAWCGMNALLGLWMAASLAAGIHAAWLLITTRTRLSVFGHREGATFELAGKASTPYAACLTVAACGWLALHALPGGLQ
ncbi:prepilin peptidase [Paraburkholderia xenovorans]|uniref:A24 family peptidase n=1 Tax=Paraburkholderia xenovorans TaxID=36873 RepID=UPI0038B85661